ncbi:hypothetical protein ACQJBY_001581 [Aegilops geniculata]
MATKGSYSDRNFRLFVACANSLFYKECHQLLNLLHILQTSATTGRGVSAEMAHVWNKAVDETLGRLVVYLSSRGW